MHFFDIFGAFFKKMDLAIFVHFLNGFLPRLDKNIELRWKSVQESRQQGLLSID